MKLTQIVQLLSQKSVIFQTHPLQNKIGEELKLLKYQKNPLGL